MFQGVPISTQWGPQGYFYPIQIAQFGLSHYSKNMTDKTPRMTVYEEAEDGETSRWSAPDRTSQIRIVHDEERNSNVLEFQTSGRCFGNVSLYNLCEVRLKGVLRDF